MTARRILRWPDKRLRSAAKPVSAITDNIRAVWEDMIDTMEAMQGVGLAAPQIGVMLGLAVVDASTQRGQAVLMANPVVLNASDTSSAQREASPCLPGVSAIIERPAAVNVRFLNSRGVTEEKEFTGLWATSVQHQIDHLAGRMYFDRLSRLKRQMLLKRAGRPG